MFELDHVVIIRDYQCSQDDHNDWSLLMIHLSYYLGKTNDLIASNSETTVLEKIFIGKNGRRSEDREESEIKREGELNL